MQKTKQLLGVVRVVANNNIRPRLTCILCSYTYMHPYIPTNSK